MSWFKLDEVETTLKDCYHGLARKFRRDEVRIEEAWHSFSERERTELLERHVEDWAGFWHNQTHLNEMFMSEWTLAGLTPSPDFVLDMLKHRASNTLATQYTTGVNGRPGDYLQICAVKGVPPLPSGSVSEDYTLFFSEEKYGQVIKATRRELLQIIVSSARPLDGIHFVVPKQYGEGVMLRQLCLHKALTYLVDSILEMAVVARQQTVVPKRPHDVSFEAMAELPSQLDPKKIGLPGLAKFAANQKLALFDNLILGYTEPTFLTYQVELWLWSRPEMVLDDKGYGIASHHDEYVSEAVFEAVDGAVQNVAVWDYISRLVPILIDSSDKHLRATVLQELSNACHLEYTRCQAMLRRHVSTDRRHGGMDWFKRTVRKQKDGQFHIAMKGDPEVLTVDNPQLHYRLRLCQAETTWSKADDWLRKIADLYRSHPEEKRHIESQEVDALNDLSSIVTFMQALSSAIQLPTINKKRGNTFVAGFQDLQVELGQFKRGIDLQDFAVPVLNLLEPGMADGAHVSINHYITEKSGSSFSRLYGDLVNDSVSNIHTLYERQRATEMEARESYVTPTAPLSQETRIEQRRQKEKTRPTQNPSYDIAIAAFESTSKSEESSEARQTFKVKSSTFDVFSTLFARTSAARGSVAWTSFVAAMTDLGFAVTPEWGSIFTFNPPQIISVQRNITFHRPHESHIEGWRLLIFSRRLKRVYGWDEETFTS